jgi:glycerol-3-phosphate acyltransferase PlsX
MGGDHGPSVVVPGAVAGARAHNTGLYLVGREAEIRAELAKADVAGLDIDVVNATETIDMHDHPAQAVRRKPDSSINVALRLVKEGKADAMLSAGNSGAVMAASLMVLGRIKGIDRPAITSGVPNAKGSFSLLVDLGAVTDPKPINMVQFAVMGQIYARSVMGFENPTIGLVSNGEEESKGNALVLQVHPMLKATEGLNFIGNIEGNDILAGDVNVCVMDGFTGNVVLKSIEGVVTLMMNLLKEELTASFPRKIGALMLKPAFRSVAGRLDYAGIGGAPLLGVDGTVIISHGRSSKLAIENAVGACVRAAKQDLPGKILQRVGATIEASREHADA